MTKIVLKKLRFSNMFSYGRDNELDLDSNRITQLTASNGVGKTSVALIIQELLFSKNIKGVKKGDILNRWSKDKDWKGLLQFTVNDKEYILTVYRTGATSKVKLQENGIDISEHKVPDTYKRIEDILGINFEVFSQLTYQSSVDLLDFLKATDTNRKKFLINLFNLERYVAIGERIKLKAAQVDKELLKLQGELKSVDDFLNNTSISEYMQERAVFEADSSAAIRIAAIDKELINITETCKRIDKNNMYISERDSLLFDISLQEPEPFAYTSEYQTLKLDLAGLIQEIDRHKRELKGLKINDKCPACGQPIDNSHLLKLQTELQDKIEQAAAKQKSGLLQADVWEKAVQEHQKQKQLYEANKAKISRFEQLLQLIDDNMPKQYPDHAALSLERKNLSSILTEQQKQLAEITDYNRRVSAHNAKVDALKEQKSEFLSRQSIVKADILNKSSQSNALTILKKAFSTSGIVAFKLENLTKELETTINHYLSTLSDGQFQVEFSLDKEKLNISVISNGISAPIETVSGGEFSRIQTSILLAIRSLLSKLGGSSVNLLFLDEVMAVLDDAGKEGLIDSLQKETELNVFLISHEFKHPLIPTIEIKKKDNLSEIIV